MAKIRQKAGDLNWMPKVAPWRVAILAKLAILAKMANLDGEKSTLRGLAIQIRWQKWPLEEWRWRIIAVSAKYAIFAKIAMFKRGPLPCHWKI